MRVEGADGNPLAVTELGGADRAIVVLAGGPGAYGPLYLECLRPLSELCRVVLWDYRGCGGSAPAKRHGVEADLDDLRALCEQLGLTKPVLLGHSYGGALALREAREQPRAVSGLILSGPIATSEATTAARKRKLEHLGPEDAADWKRLGERLAAGEATAAELERYWVLEATCQVCDPQWVPRLVEELHIAWDVLRAAQPSVADLDLRRILGKIRLPTLIVTGREDICAGNDPIMIAEAMPNAELHRLEEVGHTAFLEWNEKFVEIVRDWLVANDLVD